MHEQFLHYLWKHKLYSLNNLITECNQQVEVIHPGEYNTNAGPDFFNAKIKLNNILWVGNVEIHSKASEWHYHQHHTDGAYNNVILHVVEEVDCSTQNALGKTVPALKMLYSSSIHQQYRELINSVVEIPCAHKLHKVSEFEMSLWMQRMLVERLKQKCEGIKTFLKKAVNNWDEIFYLLLFRSFGQGVNGLPFELLAKSIPLNILLKYCDRCDMVEALLFGQAGFLSDEYMEDSYYLSLLDNYKYLRNKHQLKPIDSHLWKFLRLRPPNFPTIKIAQLVQLLIKTKGVFGSIINVADVKTFEQLMEVSTSEYWETHYTFSKTSKKKTKSFSKESMTGVVLNALVPYLMAYGKAIGSSEMQDRAMKWLQLLKPENNHIIKQWRIHGVTVKNAADSQALIYLFNYYCKSKRCLHCRIGHQVLAVKNNCE